MKTQKEMIVDYILEFGSITGKDASDDLGIEGGFRARISELRDEGIDIKSINETSKNRYGRCVTYHRYFLDEERIKKSPVTTTETRDLDKIICS